MSESVWTKIARLRQNDASALAPAVRRAWDRGRSACGGLYVNVATVPDAEDLVDLGRVVMVEALRVQALQDIYLAQGATKAASVLKSWHGYGAAFDVIHAQYGWFTNADAKARWPDAGTRERAGARWYRAVAGILTREQDLAWGGLWRRFPDSPHFQSARVPVSPPAAAEARYHAAGGGAAGRQAVWEMYTIHV
jgi:hypothetical protein